MRDIADLAEAFADPEGRAIATAYLRRRERRA
jgi:hypothetical protein